MGVSILDKFKALTKEEKNLVQSITPDNADKNSRNVTESMIVDILRTFGSDKAKDALARTKAYEDAESNILDFTIVKMIVISNIISPNDLVNVTINYDFEKINLPLHVKQRVLDAIKTHMSNEYDFEKKQYKIVEEALFDRGAYCQLIVPHSEYMRMTGRKATMGVGRNVKKQAINSGFRYEDDTATDKLSVKMTIESDVKVVGKDGVRVVNDANKWLDKITLTTDLTKLTRREKESKFLKDKFRTECDATASREMDKILEALLSPDHVNYSRTEYIELREDPRSKYRPLVMDIPMESVIPVIDIAAPETHYGYFILIDENGLPVSKSSYADTLESDPYLRPTVGGTMDLTTSNANNIMMGDNLGARGHDKQLPKELFKKSIEGRLKTFLLDMVNGKDISSTDLDLMMMTMFTRALANKETQVLFVPESMLVYYAFKVGKDGVGESVYSNVLELLSMKKYTMVASYLSFLDNTTPKQNITVDLDNIPANNIEQYLATVKDLALNSKLNPWVNAAANPYDITEKLREHSISVIPKHASLSLPEISTEVENRDLPEFDEGLMKMIDDAIYNKLGVLASVVQDGYENEYAVIATGKQKIIGKISSTRADIHMGNMTEHVRKVIYNDGRLNNKIREILANSLTEVLSTIFNNDVNAIKRFKANLAKEKEGYEPLYDAIVKKIMLELRVTLPSPASETDEEQTERLDNYKESIENVLDSVMSSDAFPAEIYGETVGKSMDALKAAYTSKLLIDKMRTMPYYEDLVKYFDELLRSDRDDELIKYIKNINVLMKQKVIPSMALLEIQGKKQDSKYEELLDATDDDKNDDDNDNDNDDDSGSDDGKQSVDDDVDGEGDDGGDEFDVPEDDDGMDDEMPEDDDGDENEDEDKDDEKEEKEKDEDE